MARNEIKLRRRHLDENALQRHRNYSLVLQRHERAQRVKRTRKVFVYSIVVAVVTILLLILSSYFVMKWEKERELKKNDKATQSPSTK
ncbi:hypothetical protein WSM22_13230 [Cytophagales bacterium WSM2-2]|nr:hypothetical protein WSM22_13230 [Cytophagales bacterium WSM2-2]